MTAPVRVSERDLHTLLGIVADGRDDLPATGLPDSLLSDLMSVVRGDLVAFSGLDSGRRSHWFGQDVPAKDLSGGVQGFWAHYWDCPFSSYPVAFRRHLQRVFPGPGVRASAGAVPARHTGARCRAWPDRAADLLPRAGPGFLRARPGAAGTAAASPAPGLLERGTAPPPHD
jgi:hypothetical protein